MEAEKKQHEYDMMDRRCGEQRVIEKVTDIFEKRIVPLEKRTTVLEHWKTGLVAGWLGLVAWFKFGHQLKGG